MPNVSTAKYVPRKCKTANPITTATAAAMPEPNAMALAQGMVSKFMAVV